jgi:Ca2+-binding RTX toxin-like protein
MGLCVLAGAGAAAHADDGAGVSTTPSAGAATSTATPNPFGCRASSTRLATSLSTIEPFVANRAETPCVTDGGGVDSATVPSSNSASVVTGPAGVFTYSSSQAPTTAGPVAPGAAAFSSIDAATVPTSNGTVALVDPVEVSASYACVNGTLVATHNSTLDQVYVNGSKVNLPAPGDEETFQLGGGSYMTVNELQQDAGSVTIRAIDIHTALGDIVLGEAQVTQTTASPCAGSTSQTPPTVNACPAGSTYDPVHQVCEIVLPGGGVIIVSRPFSGPTGGTVLPLSVARQRYESRCLAGPGPDYAVVGTNADDRIDGTRSPERILGLKGQDRIAGGGGNDCVDGGAGADNIWAGAGTTRAFGGGGRDRISVQDGNTVAHGGSGNDTIFLGNGKDKAYGDVGNDRIAVGRGNDRVSGGQGNDTINTGDGDDRVHGGNGRDRINVGNGTDHVWGGSGADRLYGPGQIDYLNCGAGSDLAFVNLVGARYAGRHGCEAHRKMRLKQL